MNDVVKLFAMQQKNDFHKNDVPFFLLIRKKITLSVQMF